DGAGGAVRGARLARHGTLPRQGSRTRDPDGLVLRVDSQVAARSGRRMHFGRHWSFAAGAACAALLFANAHAADSWTPTRPITWLLPFAAGGPTDAVSRSLTTRMGELLGQSIILENAGGAGGMTALNRLSKSPPDGYLIATGNSGTHTFSQILYRSPLYNAVGDFTPVSMIT